MDYKVIKDKYKNEFLKKEHVVGVGCGFKEIDGKITDEKAIVVLVDQKVNPSQLDDEDVIPMTVEDYQTDVLETGEIELFDLRTKKLRPVRPGVSIGHYEVSAGTLGAVVKDRNTGEPLLLSNNHVLANITNGRDNRAKKGDPIIQPAKYDDGDSEKDIIGHLKRYIPLIRKGEEEEPSCPVAQNIERLTNSFLHMLRPDYNFKLFKEGGSNLVDCAVAAPRSLEDIDPDIIEVGEVEGTRPAELGMKVKKSGRSTGLTSGSIKVVTTTVEVRVTQQDKAVFDNQIISDPISRPGDSGSLVVDDNNKATGLLFAGSNNATVINDIYKVMEALNIEF